MTLSMFFFLSFISFVLGIFVFSLFSLPLILFLGVFILNLILGFVFFEHKKILYFSIFAFFFLFGFLRHEIYKENIVINEEVLIISTITSEAKETEKAKTFKIGKILVITDKYSDYQYGDKVKISGKMNDSYVFLFPKIEKIEEGKGVYKNILAIKDKFRASINKNFSPPLSSVLSAMTLGDRHKMSNELKEKLNISGTRHITAISGMHIALIGIFLTVFLTGIGFSRNASFYLSILFLFFYIIMIGFPVSAIRAGIMGGVYMISKTMGKVNSSKRNIFLVAAIILLINPSLIYDYGFNLSFLAVFGISYLSPVFEEKIKFLKKEKEIREILIITLSAYIFTFPYLLYNFNQVSLFSVFANLLIFPFIYLIMVFGFLFLIFNVSIPFISLIFFIPLWASLSIFLFIVDFFSKFPYLKVESIHFIFPLVFYSLFLFYLYLFNRKKKYDRVVDGLYF